MFGLRPHYERMLMQEDDPLNGGGGSTYQPPTGPYKP